MSTRGTYHIRVRTESEHLDLFFYIHSDNYPKGACDHFLDALAVPFKYQVMGINFAKQFACIDGSQFISSHDEYRGTEYRYTITDTDDDLCVEMLRVQYKDDGDDESWIHQFKGSMADFLNKYGQEG